MRIRSALALAAAVLAVSAPTASAAPEPVQVQLLGLNDFHGHLESTTPGMIRETAGSPAVPAGGAEYLATHLRKLEAQNPNTLTVSAGDLVGGSPLLSALFHDEPTIEAMNEMGLDLNAVGNHEFDEGADELRRMQDGGCHPVDGCFGGDGFEGADFGFLAANVVDSDTDQPIFPPYAIRKFDGIKVGFIGMTLEGTPDIVLQSSIQGLEFLDEADTANRYAAELREEHGVRAIVVLLHEGGFQTSPFGIDTCSNMTGPVIDIVDRTTRAVDLFVTGHSHQPYNCERDGRPITSAASFGRLVTDIDLTLDRRNKDVIAVSADNRVITRDVSKAPDITALIERYDQLAALLRDREIGRVAIDTTRTQAANGESRLGNLIADSQLAGTRSAGAVAAFMNPGGIRADILAGEVTYGEAFNVQPFGNSLVTMTLTGGQIDTMLEQQWCGQSTPQILQVSQGVTYTWNAGVPVCANRVSDIALNGAPLVPTESYRVTVNSFLADGGDRFSVLREGTNRTGGPVDLDALEAYLEPSLTGDPITPPPLGRITRVG